RMPAQTANAEYVYGFGFAEPDSPSPNPNPTEIAYLARSGQQAPYTTCLRLLDVSKLGSDTADREVVCDSPALSFTWGTPRFSPDNQRVYFAAQIDGDRKRVQIVEVDLTRERPQAKPITDVNVARTSPSLLEGWVDDDQLLFVADDAGYGDVYSWSRKTRKTRALTQHKEA